MSTPSIILSCRTRTQNQVIAGSILLSDIVQLSFNTTKRSAQCKDETRWYMPALLIEAISGLQLRVRNDFLNSQPNI